MSRAKQSMDGNTAAAHVAYAFTDVLLWTLLIPPYFWKNKCDTASPHTPVWKAQNDTIYRLESYFSIEFTKRKGLWLYKNKCNLTYIFFQILPVESVCQINIPVRTKIHSHAKTEAALPFQSLQISLLLLQSG